MQPNPFLFYFIFLNNHIESKTKPKKNLLLPSVIFVLALISVLQLLWSPPKMSASFFCKIRSRLCSVWATISLCVRAPCGIRAAPSIACLVRRIKRRLIAGHQTNNDITFFTSCPLIAPPPHPTLVCLFVQSLNCSTSLPWLLMAPCCMSWLNGCRDGGRRRIKECVVVAKGWGDRY